MKLYLIINDVQVRMKKRSLPMISESYREDVEKAQLYTRQISDILKHDMIEVETLNKTVDEAIDYTYKLHNNVNNLVGAVDMCENAIVYANKFRAFVPDIDAELTRAELAFNNGEYTQALTTVINAIDKYRPNTTYEEMIRDNAKSAR
ncbi:septation ring formation regulator EzrA [Erysipelothrix sp. D19-032]